MHSISGVTQSRWRRFAAAMRKKESRDIVLVVDDSPETLRMLTDALEAIRNSQTRSHHA